MVSYTTSLLLLALGTTTAFVPSKLGSTSTGVRTTNVEEPKIESCDALLARNPGKVCVVLMSCELIDGVMCIFLCGASKEHVYVFTFLFFIAQILTRCA